MKSINILLADDDQDDHDFFREVISSIKDMPSHVIQVYNGLQVMDYLQGTAGGGNILPDVILLDINMPKLDGIQTIARLREEKGFEKIPIYILTTTASEYQRQICLEYGCAGFFTKPAELKGLELIVREILKNVSQSID